MPQPSMLIVEDEASVAMSLGLAAEDDGWDVERCRDAESALVLLKERSFDLILADKNLPGMNGISLLRRARAGGHSGLFVMMTGFPSARSAVQGLELGIDRYIEKPFDDLVALMADLRSLWERRGLRRSVLSGARAHFHKATAALQMAAKLTPGAQGSPLAHRGLLVSADAKESSFVEARMREVLTDIDIVTTVADAMRTFELRAPRVIVIDLVLGADHVSTLCELVAARDPDVQMLVISDGDPRVAVVRRLIDAGIAALIKRPLAPQPVLDALTRALARLRTSEEPRTPRAQS